MMCRRGFKYFLSIEVLASILHSSRPFHENQIILGDHGLVQTFHRIHSNKQEPRGFQPAAIPTPTVPIGVLLSASLLGLFLGVTAVAATRAYAFAISRFLLGVMVEYAFLVGMLWKIPSRPEITRECSSILQEGSSFKQSFILILQNRSWDPSRATPK
jgi:hypothetical protein